MRYSVKIIPDAQKDLDDFKGDIFLKLKKKISSLAANPRPFGSVKLTNDNGYRIRFGDYRIVYRINDETKEVIIYRVKHRREAYR